MNIRTNTSAFRPTTLAAMIADLIDTDDVQHLATIKILMEQLEVTVGEEESINYLVDAGVTPDQLIETWDLVAA